MNTEILLSRYLEQCATSSACDSAEWKEEDHPRNTKGGTGGGRFRAGLPSILKQDTLSVYGSSSKSPALSGEQRVLQQRVMQKQITIGNATHSIAHWVAYSKFLESQYHDTCAKVRAGELPPRAKQKAFNRFNQLKATIRNATRKAIEELKDKPFSDN